MYVFIFVSECGFPSVCVNACSHVCCARGASIHASVEVTRCSIRVMQKHWAQWVAVLYHRSAYAHILTRGDTLFARYSCFNSMRCLKVVASFIERIDRSPL